MFVGCLGFCKAEIINFFDVIQRTYTASLHEFLTAFEEVSSDSVFVGVGGLEHTPFALWLLCG